MPVILKTNDFDELSEAQQSWNVRYRPLETGPFRSSLAVSSTEHCQIDFETWNQSIEMCGAAPDKSYCFALPAYKNSTFKFRGMDANDRQLLCLRPGAEVHTITGRVDALVAVAIDADFLEGKYDGAIGEILDNKAAGQTLLQFSDVDLQAIQNVLRSAAHNDDKQWHAKARWVRDEIMIHLSNLLLTDIEHKQHPGRNKQYSLARRARDIMLQNIQEPPSLHEVCEVLGISERTLHYTFSNVFGASPKAFLKRQRLSAARSSIKYSDGDVSITEIMTRFGFFDSGHFAKDYREMFGELPNVTRARFEPVR